MTIGEIIAGLSLAAGLFPAIATPAGSAQTTSAEVKKPAFDVVSMRQSARPDAGWKMNFTVDGVVARNVPLQYAIHEAYGLYDEQRWSGEPAWIRQKTFDIDAKFDPAEYKEITKDQRHAMLQQLLADRCKLVVHHEQREFSQYALVIAKSGPKLAETKPDLIVHDPVYGDICRILGSRSGYLHAQSCSAVNLASSLTGDKGDVDRTVVDETGLSSRYDFELWWTPDASAASASENAGGPSIFTALKEQLGLELEPIKKPLDTIVIDHIEMPSEN